MKESREGILKEGEWELANKSLGLGAHTQNRHEKA